MKGEKRQWGSDSDYTPCSQLGTRNKANLKESLYKKCTSWSSRRVQVWESVSYSFMRKLPCPTCLSKALFYTQRYNFNKPKCQCSLNTNPLWLSASGNVDDSWSPLYLALTVGGPSHRACEKIHIGLSWTEYYFHYQGEIKMQQMTYHGAEDNMWWCNLAMHMSSSVKA